MNRFVLTVVSGFVFLLGVVGVLLFGGAGTLGYWQAWLFIVAFFGPTLWVTLYLWKHDRALLERRSGFGPASEKEISQKIIQSFASIGFIGYLLVSALDHRLGWSEVPVGAVILGDALIVAGFFIVFAVFRVNSFTSATIAVTQRQQVVSTGPYAIVRHPMYAGAIMVFLGIPLALGSWWGFLLLVPMIVILVWRLLDEEQFLLKHLPGYAEYREKIRYRLAPLIW